MRIINLIFLKVNTLTVKEMVMGDIFGQMVIIMKEIGKMIWLKAMEKKFISNIKLTMKVIIVNLNKMAKENKLSKTEIIMKGIL